MAYVMRLRPADEPFKRGRLSTVWATGTSNPVSALEQTGALGLFFLAAAATLTISVPDPLLSWGYALGICLLAGVYAIRDLIHAPSLSFRWREIALVGIGSWGWLQWAAGATEYGYATLDAAVRASAWTGTAFVAARALAHPSMRLRFLRVLAGAGFTLSVVGVLAAFTSAGRVLWLWPSAYPEVWGPFQSRNDFAGFLELSLPAALWLGAAKRVERGAPQPIFLWMAAAIFAGGIASASRAGAILLVFEAVVALSLLRKGKAALAFALAALLMVGIAGAGTLLGRFSDPDPLRYRREIAHSTLQMISERPWQGYGLGTFEHVYPEFATFDAGALVEHAHNEWLEWAAGGGLPYVALWLLLAVSVAPRAVRSVWGLGVIAVLLHAVVDYPFARHGLTAWNFALIGILGADEVREVGFRAH